MVRSFRKRKREFETGLDVRVSVGVDVRDVPRGGKGSVTARVHVMRCPVSTRDVSLCAPPQTLPPHPLASAQLTGSPWKHCPALSWTKAGAGCFCTSP